MSRRRLSLDLAMLETAAIRALLLGCQQKFLHAHHDSVYLSRFMSAGTETDLHRTTHAGTSTATSSHESSPVLTVTIAYHPRLERVGQRALLGRPSPDAPASISRIEPVFIAPGTTDGAALADTHISRKSFRVSSTSDGGVCIDAGECTTALSIHGQRVLGKSIYSAKDLARGLVMTLGPNVVLVLHRQNAQTYAGLNVGDELIGASDGLARVLKDVQSVADLGASVLLRGETGSGKELVARAIHRASPRRDKPFVAVNLGAITPSVAIAELFGHEKGAFTGADKKKAGYFEQAHGGTLFLDEIGDAPTELQVALLRTLETGEIQPVGASQTRRVDVRVIAATDADLENKVATGAFRAPLLNRLATYEIWIPPLRERRDDIGRLLVRFLHEELVTVGEAYRLDGDKPWLAASLAARLIDFDWPGNVRQLKNAARQLVIGNRGAARAALTPALERLLGSQNPSLEGFQEAPVQQVSAGQSVAGAPPSDQNAVPTRKPADVTENELRDALRDCRWDLNATAKRLGISRASMYLFSERMPWFRTAGGLTEGEIRDCHQMCNGDLRQMSEKLEVSERALKRRVAELGLD